MFDLHRLYLDPPLEPASLFSMGLFKHGTGDAVDASHSAKANTYNFYVVFFSALGSFTYGYNSSIIGSVFGLPAFFSYFDISLTGPNAKKGNEIIGGKCKQVHWHCRRLTMRTTSCQWSVRRGRHYWCSHCQLDPQQVWPLQVHSGSLCHLCDLGSDPGGRGSRCHVSRWTLPEWRRCRHDASYRACIHGQSMDWTCEVQLY